MYRTIKLCSLLNKMNRYYIIHYTNIIYMYMYCIYVYVYCIYVYVKYMYYIIHYTSIIYVHHILSSNLLLLCKYFFYNRSKYIKKIKKFLIYCAQ